MSDIDRRIELERADAARTALETAAQALESYSTNVTYAQAMRVAARLVRSLNVNILQNTNTPGPANQSCVDCR